MGKNKLIYKIIVLYLVLTILLPTFVYAEDNAETKRITFSLCSNVTNETQLIGLYKDDVLYISLEDLCKITGGKIESKTKDNARFTLSNGVREFDVKVGTENISELLYSDEYNITAPSLMQDGQVYISALHFLKYIGATVQLEKGIVPQFIVIKRYDIFDSLGDLLDSNCGYYFWWDEVDAGDEKIEDKLLNAGIVALINRDSNFFHMMFDAKGIAQDAIEDALLTIVKNEGQESFGDEIVYSDIIGMEKDIIDLESNEFDLIQEIYSDTDGLGKQIEKLIGNGADAAGFTYNVVNTIEGLRQFNNLSEIQKNLLKKTILKYAADSSTLNNDWKIIYDAAENINTTIQTEYGSQFNGALQIAESTAYDFLDTATDANPISAAWKGVELLTKYIPYTNNLIDKKEKLYNAYNCSMIQLIANEMFVAAYSDWYYNNGPYTNTAKQIETLEDIKQLIILQLKSTLTTREYLIQSGYLENSYATEMKEKNRNIAFLLNKVENCKITGVNVFETEYRDDLSWLEDCIDENNIIKTLTGTWEINTEKTMEENGVSMIKMFGTAFKYGNEMVINSDGTYSYAIGAGVGGKGTWTMNGSQLTYNVTTYEENANETGKISIVENDSAEIMLSTEVYEYTVYWKKVDKDINIKSIFESMPSSFAFSSGAGGWATQFTLEDDGSFSGQYVDTDMGDVGSEYPGGAVYISNFTGKFTTPIQINDYTYSMRLENLQAEGTAGEEYYENGQRFIYSDPYGFDSADEFLIYTPGAPMADLPEGFKSWLLAFMNPNEEQTLPYYGIYNVGGEEGFVGFEDTPTEAIENEPVNQPLDINNIREQVISHYTELWQPKGTYVCYEDEDIDTGNEITFVLRYIISDEEAQERIANGGTITPNALVTSIVVNKETGEVYDKDGFAETWTIEK